MDTLLSQFHLLRPHWLFALIPALVLFVALLKRQLTSSQWNGIIDPDLMPHVLDQMPSEQTRWPIWCVLMAWILAIFALTGPTWEKLPHPIQKKQDALVIVLDMSLSMAAQDISPDRATRATQKIIDILQQRSEGLTAMVVYAGDAYTVTPLTDDADTIINLVPSLSPFIMPAMGSRPDKALMLAKKLVTDAGLRTADFLLITDGIQNKDIKRITEALGENSSDLSILTIGSEEGAPVSIPNRGFLRDKQGNIVLPKLELEPIKKLSKQLDIRWHQMSFDDTDWTYLLHLNAFDQSHSSDVSEISEAFNKQDTRERQFDLWSDQGYWLIPFLIFIAAFSFRRGWMLSIVFLITLQPNNSYADVFDNMWQTRDQQAQQVFSEDPAKAAELFDNSKWKASSYYKAGDYEKAASLYKIDEHDPIKTQAEAYYNKGNALAKSGSLEEALASYDKALGLNEKLSDAQFNKDLVEKLLEQQKQEQDQQAQQDQASDNSESEKSDSNQEISEQDGSNQEPSDQNSSEKNSSDQDNSENIDSQKNDSEQESSEQQSQQKSEQEQVQEKEKEKEGSEEIDESESEQNEADDSSSDSPDERSNEEPVEANNSHNETESDLSREERQALEQWLNKIPDDPGGLLKRKFLYQYQQRENQQRTQQDEGEVSW